MTALGWGLVALAYVLGFASYWAAVRFVARAGAVRLGRPVTPGAYAVAAARAQGYSDADIRDLTARMLQELDADRGPS